ncbi:MAG: response regulator [Sandaracinaceae bacterium]
MEHARVNGHDRSKVLVIDGERFSREAIEAVLAVDGHEIVLAETGPEGLKVARTLHPSVILVDAGPSTGGFDACRSLKEDPELTDTPVILLAAPHDRRALTFGAAAGVDEFVNKPVSGIELRTRVRSMARMKRQSDRLRNLLRMQQLTDDLLLLARRENGTLLARPRPIDAIEVVRTNVLQLRSAHGVDETTLRVGASAASCPAEADPELLTRVLDLLVERALRAGSGAVTVRVDGCGPDEALALAVEHQLVGDRGATDTNAAADEDLAFCRLAAAAHRGTLSVAEDGTRVELTLPYSKG